MGIMRSLESFCFPNQKHFQFIKKNWKLSTTLWSISILIRNYALLISNSPGEVIDGVVVVPGVLGTVTITGNNKQNMFLWNLSKKLLFLGWMSELCF